MPQSLDTPLAKRGLIPKWVLARYRCLHNGNTHSFSVNNRLLPAVIRWYCLYLISSRKQRSDHDFLF